MSSVSESHVIKAVWRVSKEQTIVLGFDPLDYSDGFTIIISTNEKNWNGSSGQIFKNYMPGDIRDSWCSFDSTKTWLGPVWYAVQQALFSGKLGTPTHGECSWMVDAKFEEVHKECICSIDSIMAFGCPSTNGKKCRSQ